MNRVAHLVIGTSANRRLQLALVLALFCLPLFVGLGHSDLDNDEAIYSFSVDRIVESGDWLIPKSSPEDNEPFLEKPPLKVWIVSAPIRFGFLPLNEFGLRFWDALFASIAFLYVFAIGLSLAGPVCGGVAVLILFGHVPLIFEHGLRGNNMEAALVLSYCGGIYHCLSWFQANDLPGRRRHVLTAALYFVLGFMTKFVAVLFLPLVVGTAILVVKPTRMRLARDWRLWGVAGLLSLVLIAPWFVYAWLRYPTSFWQTIFGTHVYTRFTKFLDPNHVNPWNYYFSMAYQGFRFGNSYILIGLGLLLLAGDTIRRRWFPGLVVLLWFALPFALMSFGTSKLYHYAYPFVPALALAGGYAPARLLSLLQRPLGRILDVAEANLARESHRLMKGLSYLEQQEQWPAWLAPPKVRLILTSLGSAAVVVALITALLGPIRVTAGSGLLFRNSGILRPLLAGLTLVILAGRFKPLSFVAWLARPTVRMMLTTIAAAAVAGAVATAFAGLMGFTVGGWTALTRPGVFRPLLVALALLVFVGRVRPLIFSAVLLILAVIPTATYQSVSEVLPTASYPEVLESLSREHHPIRTMRDCLARARVTAGHDRVDGPALYIDVDNQPVLHPINYYFRHLRPWEQVSRPSDPALYDRLFDAAHERPVVLLDRRYHEFMGRLRTSDAGLVEQVATSDHIDPATVRARAKSPALVTVRFYQYFVLLPGPYAACGGD